MLFSSKINAIRRIETLSRQLQPTAKITYSDKPSQREKARMVGINGNYWFAVEQISHIQPGKVIEVIFWNTSICLWMSEDESIHAFHNCCKDGKVLTTGKVEHDYLRCSCGRHLYNGEGWLIDESVKTLVSNPTEQIRVYPLIRRYGLVFLFPGHPVKAQETPLPVIPWLDEYAVPFKMVDMLVKAHWTLILENNCDFYHAYLHRKFKPFTWPELQSVQRKGDTIQVDYRTDMGRGQLASTFTSGDLQNMQLWFDYPYQRSNLVHRYLHWCFFLPMSPTLTRTFYIFLWGPIMLAGLPIPRTLRPTLLSLAHRFYLTPLLNQDRYALEEEQTMHSHHYDKHSIELNPLVSAFQQLTLEKWEEYVNSERMRKTTLSAEEWRRTAGAGID